MKQASFNINSRCLYIISMHQIELIYIFNLILMIVSIGITFEALGKWFLDTLGKIFCVNFLGYSHWFMSIRISQMKDHYISVDQARYATSVVDKYLDTSTVNTNKTFYKTTLPYDMIFTKDDAATSDDQVEKLTR